MSCCTSCAAGGTCDLTKARRDKLPGGLADRKKPEDFEAEALIQGVAHELEHTDDESVAMEIAMDHLTEDPEYYNKLSRVEKATSVRFKKVRKNFKPVRKLKMHGLDISIEHDKGMRREWRDDATGETGSTKMVYPYGYIRRTMGADGEQVDVFVGPNEESEKVFIIHQMKKPAFTKYDEDKVMLGFDSPREAKAAYLMNYNDHRFFGTMTQTDIDSFKRMFLSKAVASDQTLEQYVADWRALNKSIEIADDDVLQKGLLDQLGKLWGKIKEKFGGDVEERPQKTWIRNTEHECKTGVCIRLDGTTIDIDDTFTAMNGMQVDGPPAHKNCKCTLDFSMSKSLNADIAPVLPVQPQVDPMTGMPMMPVDPHDVETFEGVQSLLGRIGSIKDIELMEIASKIWGKGYNFEGQDPNAARTEIVGFLLDQRDLLGVEPAMQSLDPSPSLPVKNPSGSSDYYAPSASAANAAAPPEDGSLGEASPPRSLMNWFEQDF